MTTQTVPTFRLTAAALLVLAAGCSSSGPQAEKADGIAPTSSYAVLDGQRVDVPDLKLGSEATIKAILAEGKNNNQVMDHLNHLCGVIGPRLTAS